MVIIAPSIMCANFLNLEQDIKNLDRAGAELLHIDIMDGHFVPNLSLNLDMIRLLKNVAGIPHDVHLMVDDPAGYISRLSELDAEYVSFHIETVKYPFRLIREIKKNGMKAGIAINPSTCIDVLNYIINEADFILLMTVEPGYAGQKFIPFNTPFLGMPLAKVDDLKSCRKFSLYRWHILDSIGFSSDLRVTVQALGWYTSNKRRYRPLTDDIASVAYWYQTEPHNAFPVLPSFNERWDR